MPDAALIALEFEFEFRDFSVNIKAKPRKIMLFTTSSDREAVVCYNQYKYCCLISVFYYKINYGPVS